MYDCEVIKKFGVLSSDEKYEKCFALVSWHGGKAKYDLRRWAVDGNEKIPLKGIALSEDEAKKLYEALKEHFG